MWQYNAQPLTNPIPDIAAWPDLPRRLAWRIAQLSELLDIDQQRLHGWALAHAVLSACWDLESGLDWEMWIAIARALQAVRL